MINGRFNFYVPGCVQCNEINSGIYAGENLCLTELIDCSGEHCYELRSHFLKEHPEQWTMFLLTVS
jgi:hypothetical protein